MKGLERKENILALLTPFKEKTFISIKHCNYITAFHQFLEQHDIPLDKSDIVEGEKVSYIDRYGVFKYKNIIKIKSMNLKFQISCFYQKEWEFQFDEHLPSHLPIEEKRVIKVPESMVIVSYKNNEKQTHLYAVPLSLAEKLDLEEFHKKNIEPDIKKDILEALETYKINSMIHLKT